MIKIGYTKKTHGLNGNVKVNIDEKYIEDFDNAELLYIEINGSKVPYFIEDVIAGNELIIKFEDIDNVDAARLITSKELFLSEEQLIPEENRTLRLPGEEYKTLEGFEMKTKEGNKIGTVQQIVELPGQMMAVVQVEGFDEKLIPLNEHFISEINRDRREIAMDLPEGLLDL